MLSAVLRSDIMLQQEDKEDCGHRRNRIGNVFGVHRGGSLGPSERRARIQESWHDSPGEERSGKRADGMGSIEATGKLSSSRSSLAVKGSWDGPRLETIYAE
jgi:hypothetical protein